MRDQGQRILGEVLLDEVAETNEAIVVTKHGNRVSRFGLIPPTAAILTLIEETEPRHMPCEK